MAQLVEGLRIKPEGGGFDWNSSLHNPSDRTAGLELIQPLTEMSTEEGVKVAGA